MRVCTAAGRCGVANILWPGYALAFLQLLESLCPGYQVNGTFGSVIIVTLYSAVDAVVAAAVFAWLYNRFAGAPQSQ